MAKEKKIFINPLEDSEYTVRQLMGLNTTEDDTPRVEPSSIVKQPTLQPKKVGRKPLNINDKKQNRVVCLMDNSLLEKLKEEAKRRHLSVSSLINEAVSKELGN